jgi:hypothetical protein
MAYRKFIACFILNILATNAFAGDITSSGEDPPPLQRSIRKIRAVLDSNLVLLTLTPGEAIISLNEVEENIIELQTSAGCVLHVALEVKPRSANYFVREVGGCR